jgi:hypothetical protein
MMPSHRQSQVRKRRVLGEHPLRFTGIGTLALATCATLFAFGGSAQASTPVGLGGARTFAVLAGSGITNTGPTTITGNVGTFPNTAITGAGSITVTGTNHDGDTVTQLAKTSLVTAYNTAAAEGPTTAIAADLAGRTLKAGIYHSASSIGLSGTLTLDGASDPNSLFVFQAGSTLITSSGSNVRFINGANPCNVYWQVGSSATLGTNSNFGGTILALTSISLKTGATVDGRVLARNGAVTMDRNTIRLGNCAAVPIATPTSTSPQVSATPSGSIGTGDNSFG